MKSNFKKLSVLIFMAMAVLTGCTSGLEDFKVNDVKIAKVEGMNLLGKSVGTMVYFEVDYENPSNRSFTMTGLNGHLYTPKKKIALLEMPENESITIEKKSAGKVVIPMNITFSNPLALLTGAFSETGSYLKGAVLDISADIKSGAFHKTVETNGIAIDEMMSRFQNDIKNGE